MRFSGQVAVVTGGALGIGGGISRRLAAAGAHVVLADINSDAASATHEEIVAAGGPMREDPWWVLDCRV